jgi:hypothetical protein
MVANQTASEPLRFNVRPRLQIHRPITVTRYDGQKQITDSRVESYGDAFGRTSIELPPDELRLYAASLEPTDERSTAALEALHFRPPARAAEVNHEHERIATTVAATIRALAEAGYLKVPAATRSKDGG